MKIGLPKNVPYWGGGGQPLLLGHQDGKTSGPTPCFLKGGGESHQSSRAGPSPGQKDQYARERGGVE